MDSPSLARSTRWLLQSLVLVCAWAPAFAQQNPGAEDAECGVLHRPDFMAPMDYRTDEKKLLKNVELNHFAPNVESLTRPMFQYFGSDISYTLHAFPNHPRALLTLIRLSEKERTDQPKGLPYSVDCFMRRALRFRPDDTIVRMIYVKYMIKKGRLQEANDQLEYVGRKADSDNPLTQMNVGLLYLEAKDYDKALAQQQKLEAMGFPDQELKRQLAAAGKLPVTAPMDANGIAPPSAPASPPGTSASSAAITHSLP